MRGVQEPHDLHGFTTVHFLWDGHKSCPSLEKRFPHFFPLAPFLRQQVNEAVDILQNEQLTQGDYTHQCGPASGPIGSTLAVLTIETES